MANIFHLQGIKVIPVNMVGIMGAGLAKQAKIRDSRLFDHYLLWCKANDCQLHFEANYYTLPELVKTELDTYLLFPTKSHWKFDSNYAIIEGMCFAMSSNQDYYLSEKQTYLFPKAGCGLGGLEWSKVKAILDRDLAWLPKVYAI